MTTDYLDISLTVIVTVNDEEAVTRCVENTPCDPDDDRPNRGWRDLYYPLDTREKVLEHWAFNCVANGYEDVTRLDGWADLPADAVTMRIDRMSLDIF